MHFPGILDFLKEYQAKAPAAGVDPLGWYLPPFAYAYLQVLGDAVEGAKLSTRTSSPTTSTAILQDHRRRHHLRPGGEWSKPRVLEVQWQNIKSNNLDEFKDTKTEVILEPAEYRTGKVIAPYNGSGE